jgi:hypothetical protein
MLALLVPLMLAAQQPALESTANDQALIERNALEEAFVDIYAPYAAAQHSTPPWEFPIYSAEVTGLIAQWRRTVSDDEPDALNDGDWLCQCQEWDSAVFAATIVSVEKPAETAAELDVTVDLGIGSGAEAARSLTLFLQREEGAWKVDDIVADSFPGGLKQALREAIAARAGERG